MKIESLDEIIEKKESGRTWIGQRLRKLPIAMQSRELSDQCGYSASYHAQINFFHFIFLNWHE